MATVTFEKMEQDPVVMSIARVVTLANEAASAQGMHPADCLVSIAEEPIGGTWRVHYGPRDYVGRRGGDLIVFVDATTGTVQRVVRGQ